MTLNAKEGMVYHIKDEYFELVQGCDIKHKTITGRTYPAYCCYIDKSNGTIWMIPMSTKVEKYIAVYNREIEKYGRCLSVVFTTYDQRRAVFQVQNMFPITEKYILHPHTRKGKVILVERAARKEIRDNFDKLREFEQRGIPCILSDIKSAEQFILRDSINNKIPYDYDSISDNLPKGQ